MHITGKILRWGNSYGIRISKKELEANHLRVGQALTCRVEPAPVEWNLPVLRGGGITDFAANKQAYLLDAVEEDWR